MKFLEKRRGKDMEERTVSMYSPFTGFLDMVATC